MSVAAATGSGAQARDSNVVCLQPCHPAHVPPPPAQHRLEEDSDVFSSNVDAESDSESDSAAAAAAAASHSDADSEASEADSDS